MNTKITPLLAMCFSATSAYSQEATAVTEKTEAKVQIRRIIESQIFTSDVKALARTNGMIQLRESAPSGLLNTPGKKKAAVLPKDSYLQVLDQKRVSTLFTKQEWLKVRTISKDDSSKPKVGWIYFGKTKDGKPYAEMLDKEAVVKAVTSPESKQLKKEIETAISTEDDLLKIWKSAQESIEKGDDNE